MASASAQDKRLTEEQLNKLPSSFKSFLLLNRQIIDNGGKGINAVSFRKAEFKYAVTAIYDKKNANPPIHIAMISAGHDGADIGFKIYEPCIINSTNESPVNIVIRVDEKNVSSALFCGPDPTTKGATQKVYIIKTQAGKEYIRDQFSMADYVFIDFGNGVIPFATDGFDVAWEQKNDPAL